MEDLNPVEGLRPTRESRLDASDGSDDAAAHGRCRRPRPPHPLPRRRHPRPRRIHACHRLRKAAASAAAAAAAAAAATTADDTDS